MSARMDEGRLLEVIEEGVPDLGGGYSRLSIPILVSGDPEGIEDEA